MSPGVNGLRTWTFFYSKTGKKLEVLFTFKAKNVNYKENLIQGMVI